jgi:hypothetical protein
MRSVARRAATNADCADIASGAPDATISLHTSPYRLSPQRTVVCVVDPETMMTSRLSAALCPVGLTKAMKLCRSVLVAVFLGGSGCALSFAEDLGPLERSDSGQLADANAVFAGSCEFLQTCGNRGIPTGLALWGCEGLGLCDDEALWIAAPRNGGLGLSQTGLCGRTIRICRGLQCTNAVVRDRGHSDNRFELSRNVMKALGVKAAMTSSCGGYGSASVVFSLQ